MTYSAGGGGGGGASGSGIFDMLQQHSNIDIAAKTLLLNETVLLLLIKVERLWPALVLVLVALDLRLVSGTAVSIAHLR